MIPFDVPCECSVDDLDRPLCSDFGRGPIRAPCVTLRSGETDQKRPSGSNRTSVSTSGNSIRVKGSKDSNSSPARSL